MLLVLEHSDLSGSDRLGETLRDHGHRLEVVRLHRGEEIPGDLREVDGILTCGGGPSANDRSLGWIKAEIDCLRVAHEAAKPIVGICLGSQILGRALGGKVAKLKGGIELGWHDVALTPVGCEDPLLAGIAWTSAQPHWHAEEVTELPDGARVLASSERCVNQAWAVGLWTYAFQYHPEIEPDALQRWADDDPAALKSTGLTRERLDEQTARHYPACARLADRLFESIALLLMPVDRRVRGVVKDLHH